MVKEVREVLALVENSNRCPECGNKLIRAGGCIHCSNPMCGWGRYG